MKFKKDNNMRSNRSTKSNSVKSHYASNRDIFGAVLADSVIFNQMF